MAAHETNVKAADEEITKLEEKSEAATKEQTTLEEQLRKKKTKLETEVTNMIAKYDVDVTGKQTEIDELNVVYNEELKKLKELTAFFDKVDADKANEDAEEAKLEEERQRLRTALGRLDKASARIQALARGVLSRAAAKKGGKKGKKGKKKKK